jgi:hypothetical protein
MFTVMGLPLSVFVVVAVGVVTAAIVALALFLFSSPRRPPLAWQVAGRLAPSGCGNASYSRAQARRPRVESTKEVRWPVNRSAPACGRCASVPG